MNDQVIIEETEAHRWAWRRLTADHSRVLAIGGETFTTANDAMYAALAVNIGPYLLVRDGGVEVDIDIFGGVTQQ